MRGSRNSFSIKLRKTSMDPFPVYRRNSRGPLLDSPAKVHPKIMFGPGMYLTSEFILQNSITHIINCAYDEVVPKKIREAFEDNYFVLNAIDSYDVNITDWYPLFEHIMNIYLRDSTSKVIYVNCQMGMNRSGFLTVLYACMKFRYPYDAVTKAVLLQRPCALLNYKFDKQVQEYISKNIVKE